MLTSFKEYQKEDLDNEEISDLLDDTYKEIVGYIDQVRESEDLAYKIDTMVVMLDAIRAYLAFSTASLLDMKLTKNR